MAKVLKLTKDEQEMFSRNTVLVSHGNIIAGLDIANINDSSMFVELLGSLEPYPEDDIEGFADDHETIALSDAESEYTPKQAWQAAAVLLRKLADAADEEAKTASDHVSGEDAD